MDNYGWSESRRIRRQVLNWLAILSALMGVSMFINAYYYLGNYVQIMYFLVLYCAYSVSFIFFAHVRMQTLEKKGKSIRDRDLKVIFYLFFILGFLISAGFMGFMRGISGGDCDECHKWRNLYEFHEVESTEVSSISLGGIPAVPSSEGATTQAAMHSCSTVTRQDI